MVIELINMWRPVNTADFNVDEIEFNYFLQIWNVI